MLLEKYWGQPSEITKLRFGKELYTFDYLRKKCVVTPNFFLDFNKYILLDVLVCSIAQYLYELCCNLTSPIGRVKIRTTKH